MKGLTKILLEGRIEDAERYIQNAGQLRLRDMDESEEIFGHFVHSDPSGNQKYLMWMVKMYDTDSGFSPNMLVDLVERFHKNLDKIHPSLILDVAVGDSKITTAPKNIDSYSSYRKLEMVVKAAEEVVTKKQKETEAKSGVDKLYEDDRWLLVKPNTFEGSCYYGSSTKWCTASRDNPNHFEDYSERGNLFYIIDKSHELGDFYKIALFKEFRDGSEEWYDRADNELKKETEQAIYSMLPRGMKTALISAHKKYKQPEQKLTTIEEFQGKLTTYMGNTPKLQTINSESGIWTWVMEEDVWTWNSKGSKDAFIQATPFWNGRNEIPFDSWDGKTDIDENDFSIVAGPESMETSHLGQQDYLNPDSGLYRGENWGVRAFLHQIYFPLLKQQLNGDFFKDLSGSNYSTWSPSTEYSTFKFKYPPRKGTMTQKFVDYVKQNPGSTSKQFYEDVLGYPKPRGHNNSFFSSIKDSGIVKMERKGRQFGYSLGPNHEAWVGGTLLRT